MKRFSKVLLICVAGGLLLTLAFVLHVPSANANLEIMTFIPFCETVTLSASDPLYVAAIPDWSHPNVGPYVVYWLKMGSMDVIPRTTINQGNSFCTELPPELTPSGEYQHFAEVNAFRFEGGTDAPFWVDRGTTMIP